MSVSQNPNAETELGPGQRLGALGAKIRNSRSLQSLEVATMDGVRQMVDTATNMGGSMVSRYIRGKYCQAPGNGTRNGNGKRNGTPFPGDDSIISGATHHRLLAPYNSNC